MAIIKCSNGHYYDDKRDVSCPYCAKLNGSINKVSGNDFNEQLTSFISPEENDDNTQLTEAYGEDVSEFEKTIGIFNDESQNVLTVAWLVCIDGLERGKSFVIHSGRNFAGRSFDMDIVFSGDNSVEREKHFSIVYDPKTITFYLVCGTGHTYLNGEVVSSEKTIVEGDIIQVGKSKYMFVPFCKEGRDWN